VDRGIKERSLLFALGIFGGVALSLAIAFC
jgi:hypothetical protein